MFGRKKKDDWWQRSNEEQNAEITKTEAAADTAADAPEETAEAEEPQKKHRWRWLEAAGDILEVVIDFVMELFD